MGVLDFFNDTKGEMKHVSWPTRRQALWYTAVVLIVSAIVALLLGLFDFLFSGLLDRLVV